MTSRLNLDHTSFKWVLILPQRELHVRLGARESGRYTEITDRAESSRDAAAQETRPNALDSFIVSVLHKPRAAIPPHPRHGCRYYAIFASVAATIRACVCSDVCVYTSQHVC